jgi:hypothetical protein
MAAMGHREEALGAIQEAIGLHLQLAKERPAVYDADLAVSLNGLSNRLSELDHREDALDAILVSSCIASW